MSSEKAYCSSQRYSGSMSCASVRRITFSYRGSTGSFFVYTVIAILCLSCSMTTTTYAESKQLDEVNSYFYPHGKNKTGSTTNHHNSNTNPNGSDFAVPSPLWSESRVQEVHKTDHHIAFINEDTVEVDYPAGTTSSIVPLSPTNEPIYLGNLFGTSSISSTVSSQIFVDGLKAAFPENSLVYGRAIQLVEPAYAVAGMDTISILDSMITKNPKILAFLGPTGDSAVLDWLDNLGRSEGYSQFVAFGAFTRLPSTVLWSSNVLFLRASPYAEVYAMVDHLISVLRVRRIGVYMDSSNDDMTTLLVNALHSAHAVRAIVFRRSSDLDMVDMEAYEAVVKKNPQIFVINTDEQSGSVLFMRTWWSNDASKDIPLYIGSLSLLSFYEVKALSSVPCNAYFVTTNAFASDTCVSYISQFETEMKDSITAGFTEYFLDYDDLSSSIYSWYAVYGWLVGKAVLSALKDANSLESAQAFQESVFNQRTLNVQDQLFFGVYGGECSTTTATTKTCFCNNGGHSVHVNHISSSKSTTTLEYLYHTPKSSCSMDSYSVPAYVNSVLLNYTDTAQASQGDRMLFSKEETNQLFQGIMSRREAAQNDQDVVLSASIVSVENNEGLQNYLTNNLLDVVFGPLNNISQVLEQCPGLLLVDPTEVVPQPRFSNPLALYLMPTVDQQIFVLAAVIKQFGFTAAVMLPNGCERYASIVDVVGNASAAYDVQINVIHTPPHSTTAPSPVSLSTKSASPLVYASDDGADDPFYNLTEKYVLWIGVNKNELVHIRQYMERNPKAYVALLYEEFSAYYPTIMNVFSSALPEVQKRFVTQTNLPTWTDFSADVNDANPALKSYHSVFDEDASTSPASLQAWYTAGVVEGLFASRFNTPEAKTLDMVYKESTVTYGNVCFGPFSLTQEGNRVKAQNYGANNINVISMAHVLDPGNIGISFGPFTPDVKNDIFLPSENARSRLNLPMVIAIVVPTAVALCTAAGVLLYYCCYRRPALQKAKINCQKPITALVCDIQGSSNLWAVYAQEMVKATETYKMMVHTLVEQLGCHELKEMGDAFLIASDDPVRVIHFAVSLQRALFDHHWGTNVIDGYYIQESGERDAKRNSEGDGHHRHSQSPMNGKKGTDEMLTEEEVAEIVNNPPYSRSWNGLRVRIGIHTGLCEMSCDEGAKSVDYHGEMVHITARAQKCAHGGQILMTQDTWDYLRENDLLPSLYADIAISDAGWHTLRGVALPMQLYEVEAILERQWSRTDQGDQDDNDDDDLVSEDPVEWCNTVEARRTRAALDSPSAAAERVTGGGVAAPFPPEQASAMVMNVISSLFSSLSPRRKLQQLKPLLERWEVPTEVAGGLSEEMQADVLMKRLADRATETVTFVGADGEALFADDGIPVQGLKQRPSQQEHGRRRRVPPLDSSHWCSQRFLSCAGKAGNDHGRGIPSLVNPLVNSANHNGFDDNFASLCLMRVDELLSGTGILLNHGSGAPPLIETDRLSHLAVSFHVSTTSVTEDNKSSMDHQRNLENSRLHKNASFLSFSDANTASANHGGDVSNNNHDNYPISLNGLPHPPPIETLHQVGPQGNTCFDGGDASASAEQETGGGGGGGLPLHENTGASYSASPSLKLTPSSSNAYPFSPLSLRSGGGGGGEGPGARSRSPRSTGAPSGIVVNLPCFGGVKRPIQQAERTALRAPRYSTPPRNENPSSPRTRNTNPRSSTVVIKTNPTQSSASGVQQTEDQVKAYTFSIPMNGHNGRAPSPKNTAGQPVTYQSSKGSHLTLTTVMSSAKGVPVSVVNTATTLPSSFSSSQDNAPEPVDRYNPQFDRIGIGRGTTKTTTPIAMVPITPMPDFAPVDTVDEECRQERRGHSKDGPSRPPPGSNMPITITRSRAPPKKTTATTATSPPTTITDDVDDPLGGHATSGFPPTPPPLSLEKDNSNKNNNSDDDGNDKNVMSDSNNSNHNKNAFVLPSSPQQGGDERRPAENASRVSHLQRGGTAGPSAFPCGSPVLHDDGEELATASPYSPLSMLPSPPSTLMATSSNLTARPAGSNETVGWCPPVSNTPSSAETQAYRCGSQHSNTTSRYSNDMIVRGAGMQNDNTMPPSTAAAARYQYTDDSVSNFSTSISENTRGSG